MKKLRLLYFNLIPGEERLGVMVTKATEAELKKRGAIPTKSVCLEVFVDVDPDTMTEDDEEEAAKAYHPEYCKFDNYQHPTKIVADVELLQMAQIDDFRTRRAELFAQLDKIQLRAMAEGRQDILEEVSKDKQILRDVPETMRLKSPTRVIDLFRRDYGPLRIDYDTKYTMRFNAK